MEYRLPTEIKWEYFARRGDKKPFGSVEKSLAGYITKDLHLANENTSKFPRPAKEKGSYGESKYGITDVRGNVLE